MTNSRHHLLGPSLLVSIALALGLAGCSDDTETAATTSTTPSTCTAVQDLTTALSTLLSTDTLSGGQSAIDAALADVQNALDEVDTSASADFGDDIEAVSSALDELSGAVDDLGTDESLGDTLTALGTTINAVVDSFATLSADVSAELSDCEVATPTTVAA
jgi:hypothetical protein